jgi:hypothetical protein
MGEVSMLRATVRSPVVPVVRRRGGILGHFFKLLTEQIHSPGIQVAPERHNPQTKRVDTRLIEIDGELSASEPRVWCPANYYLFTTSICLSITRSYTDRS